jgi:hypothetical protein
MVEVGLDSKGLVYFVVTVVFPQGRFSTRHVQKYNEYTANFIDHYNQKSSQQP